MPVYDHIRREGEVHIFRFEGLSLTVLPPVWARDEHSVSLILGVDGGNALKPLAYDPNTDSIAGVILREDINRRYGRLIPYDMAHDIAEVLRARRHGP